MANTATIIRLQRVCFIGTSFSVYYTMAMARFLYLAPLLLANAFFLRWSAFRMFNPFDMGGILDGSWRVFQGQKPFVDFVFIMGPLHLYMNAFFFAIFGFGKTAIWMALVTIHSVAIICTALIAAKLLPAWLT